MVPGKGGGTMMGFPFYVSSVVKILLIVGATYLHIVEVFLKNSVNFLELKEKLS